MVITSSSNIITDGVIRSLSAFGIISSWPCSLIWCNRRERCPKINANNFTHLFHLLLRLSDFHQLFLQFSTEGGVYRKIVISSGRNTFFTPIETNFVNFCDPLILIGNHLSVACQRFCAISDPISLDALPYGVTSMRYNTSSNSKRTFSKFVKNCTNSFLSRRTVKLRFDRPEIIIESNQIVDNRFVNRLKERMLLIALHFTIDRVKHLFLVLVAGDLCFKQRL